ncbi:OmpA family protein [Bosea sp. BIWAKO-01]|uniref:OmpA family protein n=1 Tax=Bosea sp. BIWAKO-01 TaxID=506668 RepID=UPI00086D0F69|nr:OmpA family protein [Bosea sp. BIWAKO-01]GAU80327.1 OmpA/MotB domain protein [Bosea sp. BIWAKO-01]
MACRACVACDFPGAGPLPSVAKDAPGSGDHPLVGRYKGSEIILYQTSDFDRVDLLAKPIPRRFAWPAALPDDLRLRLDGKSFRIVYRGPADRSAFEVDANFAESLKAKGFETLFACTDTECLSGETSFYQLGGFLDDTRRNGQYGQAVTYRLARLSRPAGDVHVALLVGKSANATHVAMRIVESKPMQGDQIAFIDAGQMRLGLDNAGRVALYGIQFDFDKTEIKPESEPTLREIAKLLQAQPALRLIVTGHTDGKGEFDYNLGLSQRRAKAVVEALSKAHGIAGDRLLPFGAGMAAPLAPNDDEAGRAKNRRVELVKR